MNITINKKEYPITVNMGTLLTFEQVTNKSILSDDSNILTSMEDRMVLIFAAVLSADKKTKLTLDEMMESTDWQEFNTASVTVLNELAKFLHVPDIEAEKEKKGETSDGKKPKNASQPTTTTA
jgi:hypothetical protein